MAKKKISNEMLTIYLAVALGMIIFIVNLLTVSSIYVTVFSIILVISLPLWHEYKEHAERKEIEEKLPDFLRDVAENLRAGMPLPQSIASASKSSYGALGRHVKHMAAQIDWGVSLTDILNGFSRNQTISVKRTVATIIEAQRSGGDVAQIFDSVGRNMIEINKIQKERLSTIQSQLITGYIVFFVFLGVLISLQLFLVPSLSTFSPELGFTQTDIASTYKTLFTALIIIQGLFSGIILGKMAEGKVIAGAKHAGVFVVVGLLAIAALL